MNSSNEYEITFMRLRLSFSGNFIVPPSPDVSIARQEDIKCVLPKLKIKTNDNNHSYFFRLIYVSSVFTNSISGCLTVPTKGTVRQNCILFYLFYFV